MVAINENLDRDFTRPEGNNGDGHPTDSPLEENERENKVFGSVKVSRFLGRSIREGSWLNWGLVILIAAALFAIYKIMSVILFFVR